MMDFLKDQEFIKLEKEYKFLSRARQAIEARHGELDKLTYAVTDIETTGLDPNADEIIEIGSIKAEGKELKDIFNKLIKPERNVSNHITELTGITQEMLNDEPSIKPIIGQFMGFINDHIIVAHNADFDVTFLKNAVKRWLNLDLNNQIVCTLLISRDILPNLENHKLHTIAKYFGLEIANRHRAIGDAELTFQIWIKLMDKLKERNILTRSDLATYMDVLSKKS